MRLKLTVYLAGACKNIDDGGKEWRNSITQRLEKAAEWCNKSVEVFNPTFYFNYTEKLHKTQKQIKDYYFSRLRKCDLVIVNLNDTNSSIGTAQEIQYAVDHCIPIIGFGTKEVYPWIAEVDCQVVFDTMTEAVDYVRDYYL